MADDNDYIKNYHNPHIKESRVGTFTEAATKHHEGVQEFAHHVLANPGDYSEKMQKKAQFAVNASKFNNGHKG
jgi:hypothetical protein